MKILIYSINTLPEPIGTGKYTGEMAIWLAGQGHDVRMISAPAYYPYWKIQSPYKSCAYEREDINSVTIFRCPLWVPRHPSGFKRIIHLISFALSSLPLVARQLTWKPDLVMVVEPTLLCAPAGLLLAWLSKARSWLHIQDFETDAAFALQMLSGRIPHAVVSRTEQFLMRRFDNVSTISRRMMDRLGAKGIDETKGVFFPNWVDTNRIYPLEGPNRYRQEMGIAKETVVALYAGNMGTKQGLNILAATARNLRHEKKLRFVFCGNGSGRKELEKECRDLKNVDFLELQPPSRLNELLNLADIHLLPQQQKAADLVMPSKLTGMLASGRPIVASSPLNTEIADVVSTCGRVVTPGSDREMANAVISLANDKTLRESYGQAARLFAVTHLSQEIILNRFEQALCKHNGTAKGHDTA
jgi:colanic acid biosynthesis glycosyl transferase WcaI